MVKLHCNRNGKKLTLEACTETYFMAGLSKLRQGVEFREAFKGLRVAERDMSNILDYMDILSILLD